MNSLFRKATALTLTALLGCTAVTGCGKKAGPALDGTKTLVTVGEDKISLGTAAFYTRYQQARLTQIYQMYLGTSDIFDRVEDETTGETYGETMKKEVLSELETLAVLRQHASEYGVELSEEQKKQIDAAAQAYIDNNSEEVRNRIGASKENVAEVMELQTIRSLLLDPVAADVDTDIPYEDIQQTTVDYVEVTVPDELPAESDAESAAEAVVSAAEAVSMAEPALSGTESLVTESVAATSTSAANQESAASAVVTASGAEVLSGAESAASAAESLAEEVYEEPAPELQAYAEEKAAQILAAMLLDPAADMDAEAKKVDSGLYSQEGSFTTNEPMDATVDTSVAEACAGLADGELVDHVIKSEDGTAYYVARVKKVNDEEASADKREEEIITRKQTHFEEVTEEWKNAVESKEDEDVLQLLVITDQDPFTLTMPEQTAQSGAESVSDTAEPLEEETASAAESAVQAAVESVAEAAAESAAE